MQAGRRKWHGKELLPSGVRFSTSGQQSFLLSAGPPASARVYGCCSGIGETGHKIFSGRAYIKLAKQRKVSHRKIVSDVIIIKGSKNKIETEKR